MILTKAHIGILMGGVSGERSISLKTGKAVHDALVCRGYQATRIDVDSSLPWKLRNKKVKVAFLALHGCGGEDGTVQGLLEVMGIPYTGSGVQASAIAMNKSVTNALMRSKGIPVPPGIMIRRDEKATSPKTLTWPLVVKPTTEGSTLGVSIVRSPSQWKHALDRAFQQGSEALVESYIAGREIAISVLDGEALPSVEVIAPGGFYDFSAKYEKAETQYLCPAPLSKAQDQQLKELAVRSYQVLGCEGAARVDFRLNQRGRPFFLEINTIPGMTERSLLPIAAKEVGMEYEVLTERILQSALRRRLIYVT